MSLSHSDNSVPQYSVTWPPVSFFMVLLEPGARNCKELLGHGETLSGWYTIYPTVGKAMVVFCDMETDGGGWLVSLSSWNRNRNMSIHIQYSLFRKWSFTRRASLDPSLVFSRGGLLVTLLSPNF